MAETSRQKKLRYHGMATMMIIALRMAVMAMMTTKTWDAAVAFRLRSSTEDQERCFLFSVSSQEG
ncbi:hypothetical protein C1H46_017088 [Malus baccata]|uniref:CASP-like protein n=1 Tax=Malus baccata TaxID=106549 RepID=A0A540MES3_MALBA|nr:hypothetical protein C1H46_017088 [Malus baccata]